MSDSALAMTLRPAMRVVPSIPVADPHPRHPASIGIVMHDFPLGGTERIALRLARAWIARGVAVTLFCGDESGPLRSMVPAGVRLAPAHPAIPRGPRSRERLGAAAARYFAAHRVDA